MFALARKRLSQRSSSVLAYRHGSTGEGIWRFFSVQRRAPPCSSPRGEADP